jgi:hypothetical protein
VKQDCADERQAYSSQLPSFFEHVQLTVDVTEMKLSRQLLHVSSHFFLNIVSHTSNDVPKIKKKSIGPATSLSSMIC